MNESETEPTPKVDLAKFQIGVKLPTNFQGLTEDPNNPSIWKDLPYDTVDFPRINELVPLVKETGAKSVRLQLSWSRTINPEFRVPVFVDGKAVDTVPEFNLEYVRDFENLLKLLKEAGVENIDVTLHHFDDPKWFDDIGGWTKKENLKFWKEYVEVCAKYFGKYVDSATPFNEPNVYVANGHLLGMWPPHGRNPLRAVTVHENIVEAHVEAAKIIKKHNPETKVSVAIQMPQIVAGRGVPEKVAKFIAKQYEKFNHFLFIDNVLKAGGIIDVIGVQSYFPVVLGRSKFEEETDMGWPIDPKAEYLEDALVKTSERYPEIPLMVTETGIADRYDPISPEGPMPPEGPLNPRGYERLRIKSKRIDYIKASFRAVNRAIDRGANVQGLFFWNIIRNYEMLVPYSNQVNFGLYDRDPKTLKTLITKGGKFFKKLIRFLELQEEGEKKTLLEEEKNSFLTH